MAPLDFQELTLIMSSFHYPGQERWVLKDVSLL